jgi:hypothetical protein
VQLASGHGLYKLSYNVSTHAVIQTPPCQYDFKMVAYALRFVGDVVAIHADAVTTHHARPEWQEISLATGCLQHSLGVDAHFVEDERNPIYQWDKRDLILPTNGGHLNEGKISLIPMALSIIGNFYAS